MTLALNWFKIATNFSNKLMINVSKPLSVTHQQLPLSCPLPGASLWNQHPKVYLPIEKTGEATCPYCGIIYQLHDH